MSRTSSMLNDSRQAPTWRAQRKHSLMSTPEPTTTVHAVGSHIHITSGAPVTAVEHRATASRAQDVQAQLVAQIFQKSAANPPAPGPATLGRSILCAPESASTAAWRRVNCPGARPVRRFGHSAACFRNHLVVVFGGKTDNECLNDLWVYDGLAQQWQRQVPREGSPLPQPRSGHAAVAHDDTLYVLGGGGMKEEEDLCDLWCYRFDTREWTCLQSRIPSCPVKGHTLHLLPAGDTSGRSTRNLLLCFGGLVRSAPEPTANGTPQSTNPTTTTGSLIPTNNVMIGRIGIGHVRWSLLRSSGQSPCPRSFHMSEIIRGTALLCVFGGRTTKAYYNTHAGNPNAASSLSREHRNGANVLLNDTHVLNAATGVWQKMISLANPPPPRSCGVSVWASGRMLILGGGGRTCEATNYELNTLTRKWGAMSITNQPICSCPTVTPVHGKLVFFGGCGPDGHLSSDVLELPLLPVPVKTAAAEWLHRCATDALLFSESPAARTQLSKFAARPGEGRVTLCTHNLTRPVQGNPYVPGFEFVNDMLRLQEAADRDPSAAGSPMDIHQSLGPDGTLHVSMSYSANSPFGSAAFASHFAPPQPVALRDQPTPAPTMKAPCRAHKVQRPVFAIPVAGHAGMSKTASPVNGELYATSTAGLTATPTTRADSAGTSCYCSPRTPWLGIATREATRFASSKASPLSAPPSTGATFTTPTQTAHKRANSSDESSSSTCSEDSVAYIPTGVGLTKGLTGLAATMSASTVMKNACKALPGTVCFGTYAALPPGYLTEALEGPRGPFLIRRLLGVAQLEYQLANNR